MNIGTIHLCEEPTIVFFAGRSIVELDFAVYNYSSSTAIFLKKGQYFKLIDGEPILFPLNDSINLDHYRFLFSHLTGVGHILFEERDGFEPDLEKSLVDWRSMNPFNATENELNLLFDTNEFIEQHLDPTLPITTALPSYRYVNEVSTKHIQHSLHQWKSYKLIVQAKYLLFFAGKSIQEVAYELRFKDPSYFGRFFKRRTQNTPGEFLENSENSPAKYLLLEQLKELIEGNFKTKHFIHFYADQLNMSAKNLSEKMRSTYGLSVKELICGRLVTEAQCLRDSGQKVSSISHELGFKEVSHFSAFRKKHLA